MTKCTYDTLGDVLDALVINPVYTAPALQETSDELVVSAESGVVESTQMKLGLVIPKPCKASAELDALYGNDKLCDFPSVEFEVEDTEADIEANMPPIPPAAPGQARAPARCAVTLRNAPNAFKQDERNLPADGAGPSAGNFA